MCLIFLFPNIQIIIIIHVIYYNYIHSHVKNVTISHTTCTNSQKDQDNHPTSIIVVIATNNFAFCNYHHL